MIGKDEYIIKICNKTIKNPFLKPLAKKLFWESIKSNNSWTNKRIKAEWILK